MGDYASLQAPGFGIVFFLGHVAMSLVQKIAGLMQVSGPGDIGVNVNVIVDIFVVVDGSFLDFIDGVIDFLDGGLFFGVKSAVVGAFLQMGTSVSQVRKSMQVSGMLALSA